MAPKSTGSQLDKIREEFKKTGKLWVDPDFPANESSLYFSEEPPEKFEFLRPHDIVSNPLLFDEGADRGDIAQGALGDCWLLASLSCLSMRQHLLDRVVPKDQGFDKDLYCGAFHFMFWRAGEWKEIVIDDYLPTFQKRLVFTHSHSENEFWSALVEKAYAKIFGTFESLKGGNMAEALEDFTGGLTEPFDLKTAPKDLFHIMEKAFERDSLMGCSIPPVPGQVEAALPSGLIAGHAYSITLVKKIKHQGVEKEMVRIRNPWGQGEWNGAWSDNSEELKNLTPAEREALELSLGDDGEFWMTYEDFKNNYAQVEICNLSPDLGDETAEEGKKKWVTQMEHSSWRSGSTAGGCRNFKDTFAKNPQFFLTLTEADDDDAIEGASAIIALYQKDTRTGRSLGKTPLTIGFAIYEVSEDYIQKTGYKVGTPLETKFFLTRKMTAKSPSYINSREIVGRFKLPIGKYVIVPSTFNPNEQGNFMLRIYTETKAEGASLDEKIGYIPDTKNGKSGSREDKPAPLSAEEKGQYDELKKKFAEIAGEDLEVDAFELQQMLNESDALNAVKSGNFSVESCRVMVAIYDDDMSGKLGFQEFTELWVYICTCKKVFIAYDEDKSKCFSTFEMQDALKYLGFALDRTTFASIVTRYSNRHQQIDFNDFLIIACKLRSTFARFAAHEEEVGGKKVAQIGLENWVQLSMYS